MSETTQAATALVTESAITPNTEASTEETTREAHEVNSFDDDNDNTNEEEQALLEIEPPFTDEPPSTNNILDSSLAFSSATPCLARILLPILCIGCHVLFYYGQTAPMWKLRTFADIDAWANATDYLARRTFEAAGLDYEIPFSFHEDKDVETFTYYYAIQHLWVAKGLPGKLIPRAAAILLVIFSGAWPHIKLFLLQLTWFFGKHPTRTGTLQWLGTLGKWSLADVLVVCIMVGVLHLDWIVKPADIKQGLITDLPQVLAIVESQYTTKQLCDKLLKFTCAEQKRVTKIAKCKACHTLVNEAYTHPNWARDTGSKILNGVDTSGEGLATLRVVGMRGIYAFCGAVILSILLSFVVDVINHRVQEQALKAREGPLERQRLAHIAQQRRRRSSRRRRRQRTPDDEEDNELQQPLLSPTPTPMEVDLGDYQEYPSIPTSPYMFSILFMVVTFITTYLIYIGIENDSMERLVKGAGPVLLHDVLGVNFERQYSLQSLMWTTGSAGDWDILLMATFGLFICLGPAIRAVLMVIITLLDRSRLSVRILSVILNFVGAFCSWEVFAIAIVMVQMLMPSITNTIINNPICAQISDDGSCLQVEFNILPHAFSIIMIGWCLLVGSSWIVVKRGAHQPAISAFVEDTAMEELVFETNQV